MHVEPINNKDDIIVDGNLSNGHHSTGSAKAENKQLWLLAVLVRAKDILLQVLLKVRQERQVNVAQCV